MAGSWDTAMLVINRKLQGASDSAVQAIAQEIDARLVSRTPIKTGAARANWKVTQGETPDLSSDVKQTSRPAPNFAALVAGVKIWFTNTVPYILKLEYGSSRQAPSGFLRVTVAELDQIVKDVGPSTFKATVAGGS